MKNVLENIWVSQIELLSQMTIKGSHLNNSYDYVDEYIYIATISIDDSVNVKEVVRTFRFLVDGNHCNIYSWIPQANQYVHLGEYCYDANHEKLIGIHSVSITAHLIN